MILENADDDQSLGGKHIFFDCFGQHYLASILVPIQVNHEDEEQDLASDEEELLLDHGQFHNDGLIDLGNAVITAATHGQGIFFQRRQRGNSLLIFLTRSCIS